MHMENVKTQNPFLRKNSKQKPRPGGIPGRGGVTFVIKQLSGLLHVGGRLL